MALGERSLELELERRHAPTPEAWAELPPPPGPMPGSPLALLVVLTGGCLALFALAHLLLRAVGGN
jgi:hypothetical protein